MAYVRRHRLLSILALIFLIPSILTTTGIGDFFTQSTYAASTNNSCVYSTAQWTDKGSKSTCLAATYSPTQEVSSLSYYAALSDCIGNRMYGTIQLSVDDNQDATPSTWFNNGTFLTIGDLYKTG